MCEDFLLESVRLVHAPCVCSLAVYHALCLEQLTAGELLEKVAEKLKLQTSEISILLRLTSSGILVMVDDTVSPSLIPTVASS